MNGNRVLFVALLAPLVAFAAGCDSDGATGTPDPALLEFEGQVLSDAWNRPLQAPVHLRVIRPDGTGGWNETLPDEGGRWSMEVELREGCVPGETLEAATLLTDGEHRSVDEDLGEGRPVVCDPDPQTLDYTLFREIFREPVPVAGELRATRVAGFLGTCALTDAGTYCWGSDQTVPESLSGGVAFQEITAGNVHHCALDGEGAAWCWGTNINGALGVPGIEGSSEPVPVETDLRFVELAANYYATCGRDAAGRLHCWGEYGAETPVPFGGDLRFEQISGEWTHMCGIEAGTGRVWCWGTNSWCELGHPNCSGVFDEPVPVEGVEGAEVVEAGSRATCALDADGTAYCWGWNCHGQLGRAINAPALPLSVEGAPPLAGLALGNGYSCGLTEGGEAWCWGLNTGGQLGTDIGPGDRSTEPVAVSGDLRFTQLSAGMNRTCGVTMDGELYCWGLRQYLGSGLPLAAEATELMGFGNGWDVDPSAHPTFPAGATCS